MKTSTIRQKALGKHGFLLLNFIGFLVLLTLWQILSVTLGEFLVPSPSTTITTLARLATKGVLLQELSMTLVHLAWGAFIGFILGFTMGLIAGFQREVDHIFNPFKWIGLTAPVPVIAVIAMLWFGIGDFTVVFLTALVTAPLVYVSIKEGVTSIDLELMEMARVYKFTPWMMLRHVYIPAMIANIVASLTQALEFGIRATVFGEFMCGKSGIGYALFTAWYRLSSPEVFAWALTCIFLACSIEVTIVKPLRSWSLKWRVQQ